MCVFLYFQYSYGYWKRRGVPYIKPKFPLGNNNSVGLGSFSYGIETLGWYWELKKRGLKFGGVWNWANPTLVLVDPDYAKDILIKDFQYFTDRHFFHNPKHDPKNESLFVVEKDEWKFMRQNLSPTFTSSKMKMIFQSVMKCTVPMVEYLENCAKNKEDIDVKDTMAAYTINVIGSSIYGLELACFQDKNHKFREIGREIFRIDLVKGAKIAFSRLWEGAAIEAGLGPLSQKITQYFTDVVTETMEHRTKNNEKRQDFMQLVIDLYQATKDQDRPFTFDHLVANIIVFFIAGFDTSATTLHYALYELSVNPDIQEKARDEIKQVLEKHNNVITYETFQDMTYVRQIIEETLRLHPPLNAVARIAAKPYKLRNTNVVIEKGTKVVIPVVGFQRDPDYFPDPERFDPDRFSAENKASRNPYVYMPFGEGPRMCIGMRLALMQTTIGLVQILRNFKISLSPRTKLPVTEKKGVFVMAPDELIYVNAEKI